MLGISVQNLSKIYDKKQVVKNVSFEAEKGEIVVILGPSGSGKTTTLRCIAGLEDPSSGMITIDQKTVFSASNPSMNIPPNKRNLGMVFQSFALWPHMTVEKNVALGLEIRGLATQDVKKRVSDILDIVGLSGYESRYPSQLSGGQQQRVALARSLVYEPAVLLLDEPLTSLDAKLRITASGEIKKIQKRLGLTMLWVTHDQVEAMAVANKIIIMDNGRKVDEGEPSEIYRHPKTPFSASFLGEVNLITGKVASVKTGLMQIEVDASDQAMSVRALDGLEPGEEVLLFVKAEHVRLTKSASDGSLYKIELAEFLGDRYRYSVSNGKCSLIAFSSEPFEQVEKVGVEIDSEFVTVFRKTDAEVSLV